MGRFRQKGKKEIPSINTGSLADLVFILLFFFMVISTMRESTLLVKVVTPRATEVHKIERKSLVSNIYIGPPINTHALGTDPRIQLNDQLAEVGDVASFIFAEREARNEADVPFLTTSLRVDKAVRMRIVTQVKQELRMVGAFRLNYSTSKTNSLFHH
ncbi:MAG: biopolymer transporter ExbD [Bacteroidales bacterium]|jgi:biopolymer transport protein ExbD|nr:biopolymer transporter ExbD [Bacteroidales bacterium]